MLLQIWGNTAATFTQCFPQFRRCLIKEPQLTLLLLYEDHETLPRLIEVTPSMRVADLAIKQAQRLGLSNDLERCCLSTKECGERTTAQLSMSKSETQRQRPIYQHHPAVYVSHVR